MKKILKAIKRFLGDIFAPRTTYYYNDKQVSELPKGVKEMMENSFEMMDESFKMMREFWKQVK